MFPRKKFYRARAHCNPLSDARFSVWVTTQTQSTLSRVLWTNALIVMILSSPLPSKYDWRNHYPSNRGSSRILSDLQVEFVDVGCGFGGLVNIAPVFPEHFAIGLEIRDKVSQYVKERASVAQTTQGGLWEDLLYPHKLQGSFSQLFSEGPTIKAFSYFQTRILRQQTIDGELSSALYSQNMPMLCALADCCILSQMSRGSVRGCRIKFLHTHVFSSSPRRK